MCVFRILFTIYYYYVGLRIHISYFVRRDGYKRDQFIHSFVKPTDSYYYKPRNFSLIFDNNMVREAFRKNIHFNFDKCRNSFYPPPKNFEKNHHIKIVSKNTEQN